MGVAGQAQGKADAEFDGERRLEDFVAAAPGES
jgi:hypothetical protein